MVSTLCLLLHENVFSKQCYLPTENLNRNRRHFLPISGHKRVLLRKAFQESVLQNPRPTSSLPTSPEAGHLQTLRQVDTGQGARSPGEAEAQEVPSPHPAEPTAPRAAPVPRVRHGGERVNAPGASSAEKPSVTRYLELLLSSVIIEHQLFLLLTANDGFSRWSSLPPLKRQRDGKLRIKAFL